MLNEIAAYTLSSFIIITYTFLLEWRVPLKDDKTVSGQVLREDPTYCNNIRLFYDHPGDAAYMYALHNMVMGGIKYDKLPGEWFGPSTAALVMR